MRVKCRETLLSSVCLALLTHSLPFAPLEADRAQLAHRDIPYSVVPVHGGFETANTPSPVIVTVTGAHPVPLTKTVTATVTVPNPESTAAASTSAMSIGSTTTASASSALTTSTIGPHPSDPNNVESLSPWPSQWHPSIGFPTPSMLPTRLTFHPPPLSATIF
ncbi:hypothetical protein VTO42DRAFT_4778 [Malbranchea cinnamomea]